MDVALEEPGDQDIVLEIDGLPFAVPPDAAVCLSDFESAVLDSEGGSQGDDRFFIRFGRRSSVH